MRRAVPSYHNLFVNLCFRIQWCKLVFRSDGGHVVSHTCLVVAGASLGKWPMLEDGIESISEILGTGFQRAYNDYSWLFECFKQIREGVYLSSLFKKRYVIYFNGLIVSNRFSFPIFLVSQKKLVLFHLPNFFRPSPPRVFKLARRSGCLAEIWRSQGLEVHFFGQIWNQQTIPSLKLT